MPWRSAQGARPSPPAPRTARSDYGRITLSSPTYNRCAMALICRMPSNCGRKLNRPFPFQQPCSPSAGKRGASGCERFARATACDALGNSGRPPSERQHRPRLGAKSGYARARLVVVGASPGFGEAEPYSEACDCDCRRCGSAYWPRRSDTHSSGSSSGGRASSLRSRLTATGEGNPTCVAYLPVVRCEAGRE
jgi:hypothetical protein